MEKKEILPGRISLFPDFSFPKEYKAKLDNTSSLEITSTKLDQLSKRHKSKHELNQVEQQKKARDRSKSHSIHEDDHGGNVISVHFMHPVSLIKKLQDKKELIAK